MLSQPFPSGDIGLILSQPTADPLPELSGCGLTGAVAICTGDVDPLGGIVAATRR